MKRKTSAGWIAAIIMLMISYAPPSADAGPPIPGFIKPRPDLKANIRIIVRSSYKVHNQGTCKGLAVIGTTINNGKSDARDFRIMLEAKAQKKDHHSNPKWKQVIKSDKLTLKPGQHDTRGILTDGTHEFDWCDFRPGKVAFRFTVDYENKVREKNENNNRVTAEYPAHLLHPTKVSTIPSLEVKPR